jgi:hypothetical protein
MDMDKEIQNLKKLIASAEGDTLNYLVERLHTLISKREAERRSREREDQGECTEEQIYNHHLYKLGKNTDRSRSLVSIVR